MAQQDDDQGFEMPRNTDEAAGKAKQAAGDLTGDESLEREGEAQEASGNVKRAVDTAADKVKGAIDGVRERFSK